jgi:uncharacterized protein (TIGR03086 family)
VLTAPRMLWQHRGMEDVADRYRRLSTRMTERIVGVPDDAWSRPSPCEGWTALDLVAHLVDVHRRFETMVGRDLVEHPPVENDPLGAWQVVRDQMQADLEDPARRDEEYDGRLGRSTFGKSVDGFVCFDLVVHGWDLARATGQDETIDPVDVERVSGMVEAMGDVMRSNKVISDPVEPAADASDQDRMLAALGRQV